MPVLPLVDRRDMEPDIRQATEMFEAWIGDSVFAQFLANVPDIFRKFNEFYTQCLDGRVEGDPKGLARLRLARLNNCEH